MTNNMLLLPAHFGGALGGALGGAEGRAEGGAVDNATGDRPEIRSTAMPVAAASASAAPRPTATDDAGGSKPAATPIGALRSCPSRSPSWRSAPSSRPSRPPAAIASPPRSCSKSPAPRFTTSWIGTHNWPTWAAELAVSRQQALCAPGAPGICPLDGWLVRVDQQPGPSIRPTRIQFNSGHSPFHLHCITDNQRDLYTPLRGPGRTVPGVGHGAAARQYLSIGSQ